MRRTLVGTEDVSARVLISNEDEWVVESIRNELMGTTIAVVHVARSGHDAIYFLESDGADVIVFRHPLPDWSLLDFVRGIMQRWPDSRVIASGEDPPPLPELMRAGVRDWVAEGEIEELKDAILRAESR